MEKHNGDYKMLMILFIQIKWYKEDRNPQSSVERKKYLKPIMLRELHSISEKDDVCFVRMNYTQNGKGVFEGDKNGIIEGDADCMNIQVPNIEILKEGNIYRIKWFDDGKGNVRRRGGNEDFRKKGAKLSGYPNVLNETAFVLENGQSGIVRWNNRFSSYHGQWYEQYQAFFVNADSVDLQVFIRDYDFDYQQLADLF